MSRKLLKFILLACSLACITVAGLGIVFNTGNAGRAGAYEITFEDEDELQSEYAYGELISVPTGSIEGVQTTRFVVIAPSGNMYESAKFTLTETGQYTVVWYATVGGQEVSAEKSFLVTQSAFTVTGGVEWAYTESLEKSSDKDGIKLSLQPESSFRYNSAINLSDPDIPFAHVFPYHGITNIEEATTKEEYKYHEEARNYLITLTDCYDPTNSVTIDLEWQEGRTYWNFRAGAVGQTPHGLRSKLDNPDIQVTIDGTTYQYYFAPGQGSTSCNVMDNYGLKLYYDVAYNRVYITYCRYASNTYTVREKWFVADLVNETIYPNNPFKGFTTGEVYLTISAKNYVGNVANVDIASLGGLEGEEMLKVDMRDTKAPVIELPEALSEGSAFISLNEEIQVPDAIAWDLSLPYGTKANAKVYYAYNPDNPKNVSVGLVNGKFTPNKRGSYTIVYSATDTSGNVGTATVELQCVDEQAVILTVEEQVAATAGEYVQVPECTVEGLYAGAKTLKTYVRFEDEEEVLLQSDELFLRGVGRYVFTYVFSTPFKTYTATSVITAAASDKVVIEDPVLPEYFIKGASYTLDTVQACEYKARKPIIADAKTYMSADGGEYVEVNSKAVAINADENVRFKYEYDGETKYSEIIKVVDVGLGGELSMADLFHSEEDVFTTSASSQGIRYVTNGTAKNATLKYVNVLALSSFSIDFSFLSEGTTYVAPASVTFSLVDYCDRNNVVTLSFAGSGDVTRFSLNGVQVATLERSLLDGRTTVTYNDGFNIGGVRYAWTGSFASDRMLLWITMEGINGATCLNIRNLNDRKLTDAKTDRADPSLYVSKLNTGYQPMNRVITIVQASANDIVAPYLESGLRLTVRKPDGSFATSVDGVELNGTCAVDRAYDLKLDEVGIYAVLYEYYDQNGGYCSLGYSPIVKDEVGPVLVAIGVAEGEVVKASVGSTVTIAQCIVADETTDLSALTAWVSVFYPSGVVRAPQNGSTFYAGEKGNYTVLYCCYDEVGNYTTFAYVVQVS